MVTMQAPLLNARLLSGEFTSSSKTDRPYTLHDASGPSQSRSERVGSTGVGVGWLLNRVPLHLPVKHASQGVCVWGKLSDATLYTSNLATCIGLVLICPSSNTAAVAHISDFFIGVIASNREWGLSLIHI